QQGRAQQGEARSSGGCYCLGGSGAAGAGGVGGACVICSYCCGVIFGSFCTKATSFQISSSLWLAPNAAIPVILTPFLMIQNTSAAFQRAIVSGRNGGSGLRPLPISTGSFPGAP